MISALRGSRSRKGDDERFITEKILPRREVRNIFKIVGDGDLKEMTVLQM